MTDSIKVLHLSSEPTWRGGEQQIIYLVEESRKLGVEAVIGCRIDSEVEKYCHEEGLPFISLPFKSAYDLKTALRILKVAGSHQFDLIQVHTSKSHTMAVIAGLLGLKTPVILTRRVDFPVKNNWFSKFKYNYSKIVKIICISETIKRITAPDIKDASKLTTIHSGVDMERFKPFHGSTWLRDHYNIPADIKIIGNTSAISDQKDYFTFVDVAERVLKQNSQTHFFIVGEGPERTTVEEYVSAKGLGGKITFTGFRKNIREILPSLNIFLFTSKTEGLGTSILDAMAAKVPIVATAAGGVFEMVTHEKTGLMYPVKDTEALANGVLRILKDDDLATRLVDHASETALHFTKEKTAKRTVELYKALLSKKATQN